VRVNDLEELFTAAETLTSLKPISGNELLIVTNGGGAGVLAVDDLMQSDGRLAPLSADLVKELDRVLPTNWSRSNPIDIIGDAKPDRYASTMDIVLNGGIANAILVMHCPTALASSTEAAQAVIDTVEVKRVDELSPRDIEHDNPEFRRIDEMVHFLEQIYGRKVELDDTVTVVRFSQISDRPSEIADRLRPGGPPQN